MSAQAVHYQKLESGPTLLLSETHLAPVANLQIWARVGSADEGPGEEGLAHFHEHMLFKGTQKRGVGEVAGEIEGAGGRINAYTSFDVTVYYATVPSDAVGVALDVLIDAVRNSIFDPSEVEREQEVVVEEIRRSEDTPGHVLSDLSFRESYRLHPYRAPILGTEASVRSHSQDHCLDFFRRWYAPDNLTLVAAGDFDAPALANQIESAFEGGHPAGARRSRPEEPEHGGPQIRVLRRPFEAQRIELTWPTTRFRDEDTTYLDLLSFLLGECESSRLIQQLRENRGLVNRIDSSSYTPFDPGLFSINLESDEARSRHAVEAVVAEVDRLREEPVSEAELKRARANFLASEHFERESVSGIASKLGGFEVIAGDWRYEDRYFEILRNASAQDLLRVAQTYLRPDQLTAVALIPDRPGETLDETALEASICSASKTSVSGRVPSKPRARAPKTLKSPVAPQQQHTSAPDPQTQIRSFSLAGGIQLHISPRRTIPVVSARAAFSGGLWADRAEQAGLSHFLAAMWNRGTLTHSAAEFARASEDIAAEVGGFSGRNSMGVSLESLSENWEAALELFADVLLEPRFDPEEIERERRETLAAIARREDQLAQRVFLLFLQNEFKSHPYRLPMLGDQLSIEGVQIENVRAHHDRLIRAPNMVMAVAGDVDPEETARRVEARFSALAHREAIPQFPAPEPRPAGVRKAAEHKDRAQAHLVMGFRGLSLDDPDRHALKVTSQLLAGQAGRLFLELRDRRSLAYTVSANNVEGRAPGYFAIYLGTAPEKVDEARSGIFEQLELLLATPPSHDELAFAKRNLIGNFAIDLQRSAVRAAHMSLDALYGLSPESHQDFPDQIRAVSREDVLRVSQRVVRLGSLTEALICP